jgi:Patatin
MSRPVDGSDRQGAFTSGEGGTQEVSAYLSQLSYSPMTSVLSIDGGEIRGLIPALVTAEIEKQSRGPGAELFDLIAGTPTGGILALGLTIPANDSLEDGDSSPRYSARELADLYREHGDEIFHRSLLRRFRSLGRAADKKYSAEGLESVLREYFGDVPLGSALSDVLISSYDLQSREPFFFKSWRDSNEAVPMRRAARATSAAPQLLRAGSSAGRKPDPHARGRRHLRK